MKLSTLLQNARAEIGLGLRAMSLRAKVSAAYLSRLERGGTCCLAAEHVYTVAAAYELDSDLVWLALGRVPPDVLESLQEHPLRLPDVRALFDRD